MSRSSHDRTEAHRTALRFALLALVVLSPLPFGSVQPGAVLALEVAAYLIGAAAFLFLRRGEEGLPGPARPLILPAAAVLVVGILQLVPAPAVWVRWIARPTWLARSRLAELVPGAASAAAPQTLDAGATVDALLRFIAYACIAFGFAVAIRRRRHLYQAAVAVVLSGAFQGFYGAAEYLTGRQQIFGYVKKQFLYAATGTFINRNHYAGYLAMTLPLALALVLVGLRRAGPARDWRERIVRATGRQGLTAAFGALAAGMIWTGILLSYSRAGMLVAGSGIFFIVLSMIVVRGRVRSVALALALPTLLLLGQGIRVPGERLLDGAELADAGGRLPGWEATLNMVPDYMPLGSGLGTYAAVFDSYRPAGFRQTWDHAHNDWLESLAEGGPLVTAALLTLLCLILRGGAAHLRDPDAIVSLGVVAAILVIALHSFGDFCLRIPAVAVLLAALIGMSCYESDPLPSPVPVPRVWPPRADRT